MVQGMSENTNVSQTEDGMIPDETLDAIRTKSPIARWIRRYGVACPACNEGDVGHSAELYRCHSCGECGDVFRFVRLKRNITYSQAIEVVANNAGVSLG
jgi:DNA primase